MRNSSVGLGRGQAEIHYVRLMATILPSAAESFSFANSAGPGLQLKSANARNRPGSIRGFPHGVVRPTARALRAAGGAQRDNCRAGFGGLPDAVARRASLGYVEGAVHAASPSQIPIVPGSASSAVWSEPG